MGEESKASARLGRARFARGDSNLILITDVEYCLQEMDPTIVVLRKRNCLSITWIQWNQFNADRERPYSKPDFTCYS